MVWVIGKETTVFRKKFRSQDNSSHIIYIRESVDGSTFVI